MKQKEAKAESAFEWSGAVTSSDLLHQILALIEHCSYNKSILIKVLIYFFELKHT